MATSTAERVQLERALGESMGDASVLDSNAFELLGVRTTRRRPNQDSTTDPAILPAARRTSDAKSRAVKAKTSLMTRNRASATTTSSTKPRSTAKQPKLESPEPSPVAAPSIIQAALDPQHIPVQDSGFVVSDCTQPDGDGDNSELSDLGTTPEPPTFLGRKSALVSETPAHSTIDSVETHGNPAPEYIDTPTASGTRMIVRLKLSTSHAVSESSPSSSGPSRRSSGRARTKPALFSGMVDAPADGDEDPTMNERNQGVAIIKRSAVIKTSRKTSTGASKSARKEPLSHVKISSEDLVDDAPKVVKSRKRKSETSEPGPRKKYARKIKTEGEPGSELTTPNRRAPANRNSRKTPASITTAERTLPSPPMSPSDILDSFGLTIDPQLLELSKAMTGREPIISKPEPIGKPEVWAPGRQELCETLPYFKSAHSGCYANDGNIYAFMFDSVGVCREYMDENVIIARMGGEMTTDAKTGIMYQKADHDIDNKQPQSVLNNMAQQNALVIICGNQNVAAPTKMPHRYCILDWFKPTHVWAEKSVGRTNKDVRVTIRYRFERLDRSKPSWFAPAPGSGAATGVPSDLELPIKTCAGCSKSCPQVYLVDWMCTNPKCDRLWKLSTGQNAPYGDLDYHPAFLNHRTTWEREEPPYSLNPGVPQIGQHFGDNLSHVATRGVVCPNCHRCNTRYLWAGWRCDTAGCSWKLFPPHQTVMPSNLHHTPWDMPSDGPSLIKSMAKPAVRSQVRYFSNYKVLKYTIEGVKGSVIVGKANKLITSQPGGADDMFRDMQGADIKLERRMLRKTADAETTKAPALSQGRAMESVDHAMGDDANADQDGDAEDADADEVKGEAGARMSAFGLNYGNPYKFIASGDSLRFEAAPEAVRSARSLLNWAQRVFVNEDSGYQDFNEELVFGYLEGLKIKYHDDGEAGLGPRIATLSLGAAATMSLRLKAKYFKQCSKTGIFTDEKPLPLPVLTSSGYTPGINKNKTPNNDTYEGRLAAWSELQELRKAGNSEAFRIRSKEVCKELDLRTKQAEPILSFHLTHGDIVIMEGEDIQKFMEHQVEPSGNLRFALTCRTILEHHLTPDQKPTYEVKPDPTPYDSSAIRENGDGEAVVWD